MFARGRAPHRSLIVAATLVAGLVAIAAAYQIALPFECAATEAFALCRALRSLVARGLAVVAVAALMIRAMPSLFAGFLAEAATHPRPAPFALAHAGGAAMILAPLAAIDPADGAAFFAQALPIWLAGAVMATAGGLLWLASPAAWGRLMREAGRIVLPALALALVVPDIAELAFPLWDIALLSRATFNGVGILLFLLGQAPFADPEGLVIGLETFAVHIARQCSGVEGFALVLVFGAVYAALFAGTLRQGRFWLVVVPLALGASLLFNILRIALLILIGEHLSPAIAVNGFHSYAGWLFFTLLVLAILAAVDDMPGLHRDGPAPPAARPLRHDPVAARIVPFVVFLVSGLATAAVFAPPELGFPLRTLAMAVAVLAFLPVLRREAWRPDAPAAVAGLAVGLGWLLTAPPAGAEAAALAEALAVLPAWVLAAWIVLRVLGTAVLVPIVEELFFRAYLLERLDRGGVFWRLVAVALSTAAFAALHGRVIAAFAAGLVFAAIYLRRRRPGDAVAAHAIANAIVAAGAAVSSDWTRL